MKYPEGRKLNDMMFVREAAEQWGLTERRVTGLCKEGKIEGAKKEGRSWMIPAEAEKPEDNRIKSGAYQKARESGKRPLPIGVSEYIEASSDYYYVDKTLLIKDFIDERPKVSLFTRPRRFGKTEIFNPWSVINYFNNACEPRAFWQSTGSNEIIGEILAEATPEIFERLKLLLQGESVLTYVDTGVIYPQIRNNPASVYSFLLVAGYLKAEKATVSFKRVRRRTI